MKFLILIVTIFLLIITMPVSAAQGKRIKKQFEKTYVPGPGDKLLTDPSEKIKLYDTLGNITQEVSKKYYAEVSKIMEFAKTNYFSGKDRCDSTVVTTDGKLSLRLIYKNNDAGKPVEIREITTDGKTNFLTKVTYDSLGRKVKETMFNKDSVLYNFKNYVNDSKGNLIEESGSELGERKYHWKYKYSSRSLLSERIDYSGKEELLRKHKYVYDKNQMLERENVYNATGVLDKVIKYRYEFYK